MLFYDILKILLDKIVNFTEMTLGIIKHHEKLQCSCSNRSWDKVFLVKKQNTARGKKTRFRA